MKIEVYKRKDKKWSWRVRAANQKVVATDGGQGYENKADAVDIAVRLTNSQLPYVTVGED
jgi:uncharacterized protein YegP (UPF0339 family)